MSLKSREYDKYFTHSGDSNLVVKFNSAKVRATGLGMLSTSACLTIRNMEGRITDYEAR